MAANEKLGPDTLVNHFEWLIGTVGGCFDLESSQTASGEHSPQHSEHAKAVDREPHAQ